MPSFLNAAARAARIAGSLQKKYWGRAFRVGFKENNPLDVVTEVDHLCEKKIQTFLKRLFPRHAFWGEETGKKRLAKALYFWLVDPLDGTVNFSHGYPFFCCSIALMRRGEALPIAAAVFDPLREELFSAERGKGAFLNGRRLQVSSQRSLSHALLATGFAYHVRRTRYNFENFKRFVLSAQGVRRDGSAALNLCYVAAGRFEGFWERGLKPWDTAAGVLCVLEAGGVVSGIDGAPFRLEEGHVLASNGLLHQAMLAVLKKSPDERRWKKKQKALGPR